MKIFYTFWLILPTIVADNASAQGKNFYKLDHNGSPKKNHHRNNLKKNIHIQNGNEELHKRSVPAYPHDIDQKIKTTTASLQLNETLPIVKPIANYNGTFYGYYFRNKRKRDAIWAMICMTSVLVLLLFCVCWSGMLKQREHFLPAVDPSWQSATQNDSLSKFNIQDLIKSKLRLLHFNRARPKRKRKSRGSSYLELKQMEITMSSTSEEDIFAVQS